MNIATLTWLKALLLWFIILALAILNGMLREELLIPAVGGVAAFIASGVILAICIFAVALTASPWYGPLTSHQWLLIGAFWLLLTLVFEFGFGRIVQHKTWIELFQAYTFREGNIWPMVLIVTFISPWLAAKIRGFII